MRDRMDRMSRILIIIRPHDCDQLDPQSFWFYRVGENVKSVTPPIFDIPAEFRPHAYFKFLPPDLFKCGSRAVLFFLWRQQRRGVDSGAQAREAPLQVVR